MGGLKVYFDLMSQPARGVILFLKANKIPYISCPIALRKGEHFTPEFTKINPLQRVPVIDHNGFRLTESVAILKYLSREFCTPDHWYPQDSKLRARVDEFLAWQHLNLRLNGSMVFRTKVIEPRMTGTPVNEKKLNQFLEGLETNLKQLETMFLRNHPFLCGEKITIADLLGSCEVEQPCAAGFDVLEDKPVVAAWIENVRSYLAPHYDEAHQVCQQVRNYVDKSKL
ncbi:glutathione S-transferase theta-1-like [Tachypleus tridentatus]|uniref:glutathione S-transferase theta-1-like n=1 Tax=Tachypleus tridentatus TaxID=6853 RepID=UPI003FD64D14